MAPLRGWSGAIVAASVAVAATSMLAVIALLLRFESSPSIKPAAINAATVNAPIAGDPKDGSHAAVSPTVNDQEAELPPKETPAAELPLATPGVVTPKVVQEILAAITEQSAADAMTEDVLQGHSSEVMALAFSPDVSNGQRLASCSPTELVIWDASRRTILRRCSQPATEPRTIRRMELVFAPNGQALAEMAVQEDDSMVRLWDLRQGRLLAKATAAAFRRDDSSRYSWRRHYPQPVAFVGNSSQIAIVTPERTIQLLDVASGKEVAMLPTSEAIRNDYEPVVLAASPNGKWLAAVSNSDSILLWDLENPRKEPENLRSRAMHLSFLVFWPDSNRLLASGDGTDIWNLTNLQKEHSLDDGIQNAVPLEDNALLVATSSLANVLEWNPLGWRYRDMPSCDDWQFSSPHGGALLALQRESLAIVDVRSLVYYEKYPVANLKIGAISPSGELIAVVEKRSATSSNNAAIRLIDRSGRPNLITDGVHSTLPLWAYSNSRSARIVASAEGRISFREAHNLMVWDCVQDRVVWNGTTERDVDWNGVLFPEDGSHVFAVVRRSDAYEFRWFATQNPGEVKTRRVGPRGDRDKGIWYNYLPLAISRHGEQVAVAKLTDRFPDVFEVLIYDLRNAGPPRVVWEGTAPGGQSERMYGCAAQFSPDASRLALWIPAPEDAPAPQQRLDLPASPRRPGRGRGQGGVVQAAPAAAGQMAVLLIQSTTGDEHSLSAPLRADQFDAAALRWSGTGDYIKIHRTNGGDPMVFVWRVNALTQPLATPEQYRFQGDALFMPTSDHLLTVAPLPERNTIVVWDLKTARRAGSFQLPAYNSEMQWQVSPRGDSLAVAVDEYIYQIDPRSGDVQQVIAVHANPAQSPPEGGNRTIMGLTFDASGQRLVSYSKGRIFATPAGLAPAP